MAPNTQADDVQLVRTLLAQYDALPNWTMIESRWIETRAGFSPTKARRLVSLVRKAAKRDRR